MVYTIESNMAAFLRDAALFIPGYACKSTVLIAATRDFDRLIEGYRLSWGLLLILILKYCISLDCYWTATGLHIIPYYSIL